MREARGLLLELWSKGVELRVEKGGLLARPKELLDVQDRELLLSHKNDLISLLNGDASFLEPTGLSHIRRLAARIGSVVNYGGKRGLLVGLFRDRAIVDTGKVVLSLSHMDVEAP